MKTTVTVMVTEDRIALLHDFFERWIDSGGHSLVPEDFRVLLDDERIGSGVASEVTQTLPNILEAP